MAELRKPSLTSSHRWRRRCSDPLISNPDDAAALEKLREACGETEWEHGGSSLDGSCSGVFEDNQLVALSGYEIRVGMMAHLYIVTDPAFRARDSGRAAVAHLSRRALAAGLLPHYWTLEANTPAIRIAEALGFLRSATSMAVRLAAV